MALWFFLAIMAGSTCSSGSSTCSRCCRSTAATSRSPGSSGLAPGSTAARPPRPGPGRLLKLMPLTYAVILIVSVCFTLLTVTADIVNPITFFK